MTTRERLAVLGIFVTAGLARPGMAEDNVSSLRDTLVSKIVAGVRTGRQERIYVDFAGRPTRAKVIAASTDSLTVNVSGSTLPLPWSSFDDRRFFYLAKKYLAGDTVETKLGLARLALAAKLTEEAEAALLEIRQDGTGHGPKGHGPKLAGDIAALQARLTALRAPKTAAPKAKATNGKSAQEANRSGRSSPRPRKRQGDVRTVSTARHPYLLFTMDELPALAAR